MALMSPALLLNSEPSMGQLSTFMESGELTFTAVILIVNVKVRSWICL